MRYVWVALGLVVVIGLLVGVKFSQLTTLFGAVEAMEKAGPPPELVGSAPAREEAWERRVSAVATVAATRGVVVSNEVAGVISAIRFESGARVKKGQVLLELDSDVERAQLASTRARLTLAKSSAARSRALVEKNVVTQAQLDADEAELSATTADVAALQAQIDRRVVRAPFDGRLGIRQVDLGEYLQPGTTITVLESDDGNHVDFTLPQRALEQVGVGMTVHINEGQAVPRGTATITAIDPSIDAVTRSGKIRATIQKLEGTLTPGAFVNVSVALPERQTAVIVPATALVHASYGDSVFVIEDGKDASGAPLLGADGKPVRVARQQFVKTGDARGDFVALLGGVKPGEEIAVAGAFKLRNGASVVVNNSVQHAPSLAPTPENR